MPRFSPRLESLEQRRLMDADGIEPVAADDVNSEIVATTLIFPDDVSGEIALGEDDSMLGVEYQTVVPVALDRPSFDLSFAIPSVRVVRTGSTVVAIATADYGGAQKLWAIREGGEAGGEIAFDLKLGQLWIEKVLVDGDRALVIGEEGWNVPVQAHGPNETDRDNSSPVSPGKKIIALDLSTGEIVKEFKLPPGFVKYADFADGKATIISQRTDLVTIAIWPPVEVSDEVYRFTWDAEGVSELQTDEISSGQVTVAGDQILVAVRVYNGTAGDRENGDDLSHIKEEIELRTFVLTDEGVETQGSVNLGRIIFSSLQVSENGERAAVAIATQPISTTLGLPRWTSSVVILDLTGADGPVIEETINIPRPVPVDDGNKDDDAVQPLIWYQPHGLLYQTDNYFVFGGGFSRTLKIVDLGADVSGEDRLKMVELPDDVRVGQDLIQLDDDRLVFITGEPFWAIPYVDLRHDMIPLPFPRLGGNGLLTLSLADGTAKVQEFGRDVWVSGIKLINAEEDRFGFQSNSQTENERKFIFGVFDAEGTFVIEGEVPAEPHFESFFPHEDSITVATDGGLKTYSYETPEEPQYVIRFTDEDALPLNAVDDAVKLYSPLLEPADTIQSEWIDLLANDQIPYSSQFRTRIVELIDAPVGVNLEAGRYIWLDSRIESLEEPLVFKYKVSDELIESIAEVEISLAEVSEAQREAMIDAIKAAVSRDFGLPIDEIMVEPVAFLDDAIVPIHTLPIWGSSDSMIPPLMSGPALSRSPMFQFRVTAPGLKAFYGSDLSANVFLITITEREEENEQREPVVEFSFAVTDGEGNAVQTVESGETFWIELRGADLRADAKGMFSAFLNLRIPESLRFEGTVEPGEGFSLIGTEGIADKVTAQSIVSLGVIDADGALPESLSDGAQVLLRVRVIANEEGTVTLLPAPSQSASEETTVFGASDAVGERQIKRTPFTLVVGAPELIGEPTDVDGDGNVRAVDALRVINMVSRHGVGTIEEIRTRMENAANGAGVNSRANEDLRRFDVNRNGSITPLDALMVINHISRESRRTAADGESAPASQQPATFAVDPMLEEQELKRRRR